MEEDTEKTIRQKVDLKKSSYKPEALIVDAPRPASLSVEETPLPLPIAMQERLPVSLSDREKRLIPSLSGIQHSVKVFQRQVFKTRSHRKADRDAAMNAQMVQARCR